MGAIPFDNVSNLPPSPSHVHTHTLMQDTVLDFVPVPEKQVENYRGGRGSLHAGRRMSPSLGSRFGVEVGMEVTLLFLPHRAKPAGEQ